jgi:hypothetical protein
MKASGRRARETALDICRFKGRVDMKVLFHATTELAMVHRSFQTMIIIKESMNWANSTEKEYIYGLQAQVMRVISNKG